MIHPKYEKTFVILKPDAIQRSMIGKLITRFENVGLKVSAIKLILATEDQCWSHYSKDDVWFTENSSNLNSC